MIWSYHVQIGFPKYYKNLSDVLSRPSSASTYPAPMTTIFIGRARKALGMRFVSIAGDL